MLLNAAVFQMSQELQIRALERRLPRSQHHVHSGPEPLSELVLRSQDLFFFKSHWLHHFWVISGALRFSYRGSEQERVRLFQRGGRAGDLHGPLGQPVEQQQQETPRANGTGTHQDHLPQAGLVTPHLLHR